MAAKRKRPCKYGRRKGSGRCRKTRRRQRRSPGLFATLKSLFR